MTELLYSPLAWAACWVLCGVAKTGIDIRRKEPIGFFDVAHHITFGPITLVNELIPIVANWLAKPDSAPLEFDTVAEKTLSEENLDHAIEEAIQGSVEINEMVSDAALDAELEPEPIKESVKR